MTDSIDVPYLARLARIAVTPEEATLFKTQLGEILHHIEKIGELDVTAVEPMAHPIPVFDVVREDQSKDSLPKKEVLQQLPHEANGLCMVPKVLE